MVHKLTYTQLVTIDRDFENIQRNNPGLALINHLKIALFYQQATSHLEKLNKKIEEIKDKYVTRGTDGKFLNTGSTNGNQWLFKPSVSNIATAQIITGDDVCIAFETECNQYAQSQSFTIQF